MIDSSSRRQSRDACDRGPSIACDQACQASSAASSWENDIAQQFLRLEHRSDVLLEAETDRSQSSTNPSSSLPSARTSLSPNSNALFAGGLRSDSDLASSLRGPKDAEVVGGARDDPGVDRERFTWLQMMAEIMLLKNQIAGQCRESNFPALQRDTDDLPAHPPLEASKEQTDCKAWMHQSVGSGAGGMTDVELFERQVMRMVLSMEHNVTSTAQHLPTPEMADKLRMEKDEEVSKRLKAEEDLATARETVQVRFNI